MKKVLLVVRSFSKGGPQPLRFQMISNYLKESAEIHVLEIHHGEATEKLSNGIWLHKIEYSYFGKLLNPENKEKQGDLFSKTNHNLSGRSYLKKSIRNLFFPDTVVLEIGKLKRRLIELIHIHHFETVIASGFPFSTMALSKTVKKKFPKVKFIYDVGDPFYSNSLNGCVKDYFAWLFERKYLRYIDLLVVTNKATYEHYLNVFGDVISHDKITIIQMGVTTDFIKGYDIYKNRDLKRSIRNELKLVYAGQLYVKLREPFELYKAVEILNEEKYAQSVRLEMYGYFKDYFRTLINPNNRIVFVGKVSNRKIIEAYFGCDIIIFLDNSYGLQTPGKVFEVSVIGKPVLFISDHVNSPAYEVVKDMKHIYFCRNSFKSIIEAIKSIDYFNCSFTTNGFIDKFSWLKRAEQYSDLIS